MGCNFETLKKHTNMYAIEYSRKLDGSKLGVLCATYGDRKAAERKVANLSKKGGGFNYRIIEL